MTKRIFRNESGWGMGTYPFSPYDVIQDKITHSDYYYNRPGIEDKFERLAEIVGGLSSLFVEKGLITNEEFLKAIGANSNYFVDEEENGD